jgi:hypothetical protein
MSTAVLSWTEPVLVLSYDLHVHPGPSETPRWGSGVDVQRAAEAAGVRGFVWKAHERHTPRLCAELPASHVRAFGSASLNPWSALGDVREALADGAAWLWGPTASAAGEIAWELELPPHWSELEEVLRELERPLVLATGHLGARGRGLFANIAAASPHLLCSVTHTLYVAPPELLELAAQGAVFEIDAYTLRHDLPGRKRHSPQDTVSALQSVGALVYFTSDGGQAGTGNPFVFGAETLDELEALIGHAHAEELGVAGPSAIVAWLDGKAPL